METNDAYEIFLSLEDINDGGFSKETKAGFDADREAMKAAREDNEAIESQYADEPEEDSEPEQDDYDFSFLDENKPIWEDEQEEEIVDEHETENEVEPDSEEIDSGEYDGTEEGDYDYSVDEDTTLNLPDGRIMSIGEIQQRVLDNEAFNAREEAFNQRVANFEQEYEAAKVTLEVAELECDKVIGNYDSWDWDELFNEDPVTYASERRYYDSMVKRKNQLIKEQAANRAKVEQAKQEEFKRKSMACVDTLRGAIPGWNDSLYEKLMNYAVTEYDEDPDEVLTWNNPSEFIRLYKLYKYEKGVEKAKAGIKGAKKGGKFLSSNGARVQASKNAQREKLARDFEKGKLSNADVFNFLVD
ncbi:hypothetical protein [Enterobacter hormaechei]|uniref:hypothetical protein n=1 Tax=Enterobacter hormaechei TaxID=158836 RepID=UPI0013D491BD|nr:hypothetical protein [Enterobacter hormaechei]